MRHFSVVRFETTGVHALGSPDPFGLLLSLALTLSLSLTRSLTLSLSLALSLSLSLSFLFLCISIYPCNYFCVAFSHTYNKRV